MPGKYLNTDDEGQTCNSPEYWDHFFEELKKEGWPHNGPLLITYEELRAAGALYVHPSWRKSLGGGPRRQLELFGDEDCRDAINPRDEVEQEDVEPDDVDDSHAESDDVE